MGWYSAFKAQLTGMGRCCFNCGSLLLLLAVLSVLLGVILILVSEYVLDAAKESTDTVLYIGIVILVVSVVFLVVSVFICCRICQMVRDREKRANHPMFMKRVPTPPPGCYPAQAYDKSPAQSPPPEPSAPPPKE